MRTPIIAGNWKMNTTLAEARALAGSIRNQTAEISHVERVLVPPFPWIAPVLDAVSGSDLRVGAQNCYFEPSGAFTGEVSAEMLAEYCSHVIVGHSERRHILGESDDDVARKVTAVLRAGMTAILCVGETLDEREADIAETTVDRQLETALNSIPASDVERIVIAYEPVWAIGTGRAASSEDAQEMAAFIRSWIERRFSSDVATRIRIQYGGSVKGNNAAELLAQPDVDGALVGGASLDAEDFAAIVQAAASSPD